jgi:hypothetical protein
MQCVVGGACSPCSSRSFASCYLLLVEWLHEPEDRSQQEEKHWLRRISWHSRIQRFGRDLTSPTPLLRVHSWSYTPIIPIHRSPLPPSYTFPPPSIVFLYARR